MTTRVHGELDVRHPYVNEVPPELMTGFESLPIDPEWQWVLTVDGRIRAQMLCASAHGMLLILRVKAMPDAPAAWLVCFMRRVLADARALGMIGYVSFLSDRNPQEVKLMRIVQRAGGLLLPQSGAMVAGSLEVGY